MSGIKKQTNSIKLSNVNIIVCVLLNGVVGLRFKCVVFVKNRFGIKILVEMKILMKLLLFLFIRLMNVSRCLLFKCSSTVRAR